MLPLALLGFVLQATPTLPPALPTLTLAEAMEEAERGNAGLEAARARLDQARVLSRKVWSAYLPHLTVSGTYTRNNVEAVFSLPTGYAIRDVGAPTSDPAGGDLPGAPTNLAMVPTGVAEVVIQKQDQLGAQLQATQALLAPALWPAIRSAYLSEEAAELSTEAVRRDILFGVAQLYYSAAGLQQSVAVQEKLLQVTRDHEKDARNRYEAGAAARVELLRAEIDRSRAEQDLKRTENAYASARIALATAVGRPEPFEVVMPPTPTAVPTGDALEAQALSSRPDVLASGKGLRAAEGDRTSRWLSYLPTLGAFGRYQLGNVQGFTGTYDSWAVGLGLSWTLFDGGLREAELRESGARVAEARATVRQTEERARDEVRRGRLELDSAEANRRKAEEQLSLAREGQRLTEVNYRAGAATYLEVADANASLAAAELGFVAERLNAHLAALALQKAAGVFQAR